MASFPSPLERTVASALLLLSTPPSKLMISCCDGERRGKIMSEERLSLMSSSESKSCTSSLTTDQLSSRRQKLRIIAAVARCHEIKLKVVKKRRSKIYRSSNNRKIPSFKSLISSNMATEMSCLSSGSSGISSARIQLKTTKAEKMQAAKQRKRRSGGSTHMRRRAEAILKLLSGGCFSEVNIRRVLGDSPDTSKALRMLLKQEEVKRSGTGGQKDPYIYTVINFDATFNCLFFIRFELRNNISIVPS
ncbi:Uncharacterized protein TCM_024640 [Theobroma cacao]|uniref:HTH three-helical bundle domain-containing protein n=1 Tax=Theobroma cacao TaxID=3641 RepID=A0A061F408_THECC|nr:Uncharacterized protein TCM_024640 [Theobroma cacao]